MKRILVMAVVVPIVAFLVVVIMNGRSRSPIQLGVVDGQLAPCPDKPNCVESQTDQASHQLEPLHYECDSQAAWTALQTVIGERARTKVIVNDERYMHCECRSFLLRFVDDLEFLHMPEQKTIQVRSASRTGHSDMGVNRKRVESIRASWAAALASATVQPD